MARSRLKHRRLLQPRHHVSSFFRFYLLCVGLCSWLSCLFCFLGLSASFLTFLRSWLLLLSLFVFSALLSVLFSGLVCFWFLDLSVSGFLTCLFCCLGLPASFLSFPLSCPFCFLGFSTYKPSKIVVTIFKYA